MAKFNFLLRDETKRFTGRETNPIVAEAVQKFHNQFAHNVLDEILAHNVAMMVNTVVDKYYATGSYIIESAIDKSGNLLTLVIKKKTQRKTK